ncbi:MAG: diaminopimelate decarboxylase [Egibacteraceae bacterium]
MSRPRVDLRGAAPPGGDLAGALPGTAVVEAGRLRALGGLDVEDLAARFATPLWVLDRATLVGRMRAYREAFADGEVVYASKALCLRGVLELASDEGLLVDCATGGELATAEAAGVAPERIVLHGNNKSESELDAAVGLGVGRIVVDSFSELRRLEAVAAAHRRVVDVHLRVTPGIDAHTHEFVATGQDDSKFGFTLSSGLAHEAAATVIASERLRLTGAHCHVGSQVFELEAFTTAARVMLGFLAELAETHGVVLGELNLGGGLGVVEDPADDPPSLERYAAAVRGALAAAADGYGLPTPRLFVEPGRSVVGPAGVTLYRAGTIKALDGLRTYVAVDGGMSDNPRYALYRAAHPFLPAGAPRPAPAEAATAMPAEAAPAVPAGCPVTIVGKHCESGDVLAEGAALPADLVEGELLAALGTGAYHHAMASNYNRLGRPAVVLVGDGEAVVLSRAETVADLLAREPSLRGR